MTPAAITELQQRTLTLEAENVRLREILTRSGMHVEVFSSSGISTPVQPSEADLDLRFWRESAHVDVILRPLDAANLDAVEFWDLADHLPTLAWLARSDGYIVWYNRRWHGYCGTTPADMEGWGWQSVHDPDRLPSVLERWMASIATGDPFEMVFPLRGADGLFRPFLTRVVPLRDATGDIVRWFGVNTEIGTQVRAETSLQAARAELEALNADLERQVATRTRDLMIAEEALRQSQKIEAIGQLTGGVAHDFNNLLTVIKSSTDLLKRPNLAEERRARYIAAISDTVDRAAKLTGQLLAFARRQSLKPEIFAACDSVRALSDMMGTLTGSRIQIVTELPEKTCYVNADPSQFDTALVNMAVNARDAMDGEGRITIRVEAVETMPAIRNHAAVPGAFVAVSIADTGSGIPEELLGQIFEPFFTTKGVGQGTGLGLSQVFGFAKQSGGEVTVESEAGRGTTFTLYLPREVEIVEAADRHEPESLIDGHGTCVLVVEDNADVGTFAVQTLTDLGYVPVLATNAEEALVELERDADRFDVVFTDVVMPGMNGIDLAHRIREEQHDLPVLLASGYSHVLAQNGTYGFELLHKPYSVEQLSRLLRKVATWQRRKRIMGK